MADPGGLDATPADRAAHGRDASELVGLGSFLTVGANCYTW
jgi:hypothetical protein